MPNVATVLKSEITRVARKEIRTQLEELKKSMARQRQEAATLKRMVADLKAELKRAMRSRRDAASPAAEANESGKESHRFSAKGLASNRRRLGLSAADFGLLVGTTGQSIYAWEAGKSTPRKGSLAAIASLRGVGKREVHKRLEELNRGS
jgi:DNA-binding transcriptional regulator YiaG